MFAGSVLLVCDVLQRTLVAGAARLFPRARSRIFTLWMQALRFLLVDVSIVTLGGARLGPRPRIPARPGVLVIMNHQSLLDIPLVVAAFDGGFPRIVTRRRYSSGIPLISHMTRLYQYPTVDPSATVKSDLEGLRNAASNGDAPLVIFPEGTRTRTGELGPWKRSGLRTLLDARAWEVWVLAVDGLWRSRTLKDFVEGVPGAEIGMWAEGPFGSPGEAEEIDPFIERMRERMEEGLRRLRKPPDAGARDTGSRGGGSGA